MSEQDHMLALLEPLKIALKLEEEGKRFFSEAASQVTGKVAKQTFLFLASEEDKHIRRIEEFYRSLEAGDANLAETEDSDADQRLEDFNNRMAALKDEIRPTISDIEAYKTALKFENGAEEFYEEQTHATDNPGVRKFYRWLIHEEAMHAKVLISCVHFAENPAGWFKERDER